MDLRSALTKLLALYLVLGSWKGYLALYEEGAAEPRQIFPTQIASLPQTDREALERGILIRNQRDLDSLLQRYLS
ncbi:MAG: BofC C-terminal domain-containing protein [Oscillospiraceae bacterium]|nr:BofC C-terminal domain-containing protein [Oscillospiraceae bacterium]